jgi:hypothetical protein
VPRVPDRSALPAGGAQCLLRGVPVRHHRPATRYVLDAWFPSRLSLGGGGRRLYSQSCSGSAKQLGGGGERNV